MKEGLSFSGKNKKLNLKPWTDYRKKLNRCKRSTTIAMIGKYVDLEDSYKSLNEALYHAGIINGARVNIEYIDSEILFFDEATSAPVSYTHLTLPTKRIV